jgi:signal transduction histidine kinase
MTVVRGCCTFVWMQDARSARRFVFERPYHCPSCVDELARSAKLSRVKTRSVSMERVREVLAQYRADVVDRWDRQLKAAAAAGFALDPNTAQVLPQLLEATGRSLERRYRLPEEGESGPGSEARKAATQGALLGDFLFDVALEHLPEMDGVEQRRLSEALLQAAVEVLVKETLLREQEKRKRDTARLARLAHELRNSLTAAQLALDLLRRKGALPEGKAARALERGLARLREGIEDALSDVAERGSGRDALAASGLRANRVRLNTVLADAHLAARELGARHKNVKGGAVAAAGRHRAGRRARAPARGARPAPRGAADGAAGEHHPGVGRVPAQSGEGRSRGAGGQPRQAAAEASSPHPGAACRPGARRGADRPPGAR